MSLQVNSNYTFKQLLDSNFFGKDVSLNFNRKDKCKIAAFIIGGVLLLPLFGVGALLLRSAYTKLRDRKVELLNEARALIQTEDLTQANKVNMVKVRHEIQKDKAEMEAEATHYIKEVHQLTADQSLRNRGLIGTGSDEQFDSLLASIPDSSIDFGFGDFDDVTPSKY